MAGRPGGIEKAVFPESSRASPGRRHPGGEVEGYFGVDVAVTQKIAEGFDAGGQPVPCHAIVIKITAAEMAFERDGKGFTEVELQEHDDGLCRRQHRLRIRPVQERQPRLLHPAILSLMAPQVIEMRRKRFCCCKSDVAEAEAA